MRASPVPKSHSPKNNALIEAGVGRHTVGAVKRVRGTV